MTLIWTDWQGDFYIPHKTLLAGCVIKMHGKFSWFNIRHNKEGVKLTSLIAVHCKIGLNPVVLLTASRNSVY